MKTFSICSTVSLLALAMPAAAETTDADWTFSTSGSWSEISDSDRDAVSVSVSLSRQVGDSSVGVSLGTSNGSDALFEETEITDRSSVFASIWTTIPVGAAYLDLSASIGQDDYDGDVVIEGTRFETLNGSGVGLTSEVDSLSISAALSRSYFIDDWDLIPSASLGWSRSEATTSAAAISEALVPVSLSEEETGMIGSVGLGVGYILNEHLYLFSDLTGLYAENGASTGVSSTSRQNGLRSSARQDTDEAIWTELSLGASVYATETVTVSLSGGTTAGRDTEEVFASYSISVSF